MPTDPRAASVATLRIDRKLRMRKSRISMFRSVRIFLGMLLLSTAAAVAWSQGTSDFSGLWKQDNDRCQPKRNGDVMLRIEHHDPELMVETSISHSSASSRHAVEKYTTNGKVSVSTGADGDEFHTSVVWKDSSLVFSIEEHEDGRILQSKETWSVIEDGATLKRIRERPKGEKQTLFFRRILVSGSDSRSGFQKGA
jgi:hypothetical protein